MDKWILYLLLVCNWSVWHNMLYIGELNPIDRCLMLTNKIGLWGVGVVGGLSLGL